MVSNENIEWKNGYAVGKNTTYNTNNATYDDNIMFN